jgi:hypothetical protein
VPGFGTQFVAAAIAWLPEFGHIGNKATAWLVGIVPYDDDSGGRREIRDLLYMATLAAAAGHNPLIKPTTNGCALTARRPTSLWSPAYTSSSSSSTPCRHAVRCGTRR